MAVLSSEATVGYYVRELAYHDDCSPNGPTTPILASEDGVQHLLCCHCGEGLINDEDLLDSYEHSDCCDCEDCLAGEVIALAGGSPVKCPTCLSIFDKYSQAATHSVKAIYCSNDCWEDRDNVSA